MTNLAELTQDVTGEFVTLDQERFYKIHNVDQMPPFFVSVISDSDHWLFVSSTGGLTAGRVSPETALFPYVTVDKIHESTPHSGPKTLFRVECENQWQYWEPYNTEHDGRYRVTRNLYKNLLGNKLCFEEINHDLQLVFRTSWMSSDLYGFSRRSELVNQSESARTIELIDGLQNILPAGTPRYTQSQSSNLVDAYKYTEVDADTNLAMFTLYSGITDRAEPSESLMANTVFCLGLDDPKILLSSEQLKGFKQGKPVASEASKRGIRGAYLVNQKVRLEAGTDLTWQLVANVEQSQAKVVALRKQLQHPDKVADSLQKSVEAGSDALAKIMASADGFQVSEQEMVYVHHYANVVFNVLRGGIFDNQYLIDSGDFARTVKMFNRTVYANNRSMLHSLPEHIHFQQLQEQVKATADTQLQRLCAEYLPITFGRRHGDPSRPWNQFAIKLKDEHGHPLLSYQGNWRDIFQNWEALTFSYPKFVENVIAKFVNASTVDGYNPYRITKEGIDWEVEEPDDPWSYIGYWGDHQIIYLLKLLEWSKKFHPELLDSLLHESIFCYANVPYRIKPYEKIVQNAKATVEYDNELAEEIEQRVSQLGADGKLVLDADGQVYQVNLLEKLLVPLLSKLGNLVLDGGIWLNTQRPEWNDANNALVGQGLSMVTLYYMHRYVVFMQSLVANASGEVTLSAEVQEWLVETAQTLAEVSQMSAADSVSPAVRKSVTDRLGKKASDYRQKVYKQGCFSGKVTAEREQITQLLDDALKVIKRTISSNLTKSGLYHAYNLLEMDKSGFAVGNLYPMLEGQVAVLSAGALKAEQTIAVLEALFASDIYREDQKTFMLYPDRTAVSFLDKNRVPEDKVAQISVLQSMLKKQDGRLIQQDANGDFRFNGELSNAGDLQQRIADLSEEYGESLKAAEPELLDLYEQVFNHQAFTGRSGGMFGFEGLGCIYWHMVAKLLLAVQENFFAANNATEAQRHRLAELYYQVREGIGFNKTPTEFGAFPYDPYSHTPKHAGAQQPGMTGQVKEEVLCRFGELGLQVANGQASFDVSLLRKEEFLTQGNSFRYLDVDGQWQIIDVPAKAMAFTWCQVPIVYQLSDSKTGIVIDWQENSKDEQIDGLTLSAEQSSHLFARSGQIRRLTISISEKDLCSL